MQASAAVYGYDGDVTISGNAKIENATGGDDARRHRRRRFSSPDKIGNGNVVIKENADIDNVQGGAYGAGIGGGCGYGRSGDVTIEGNTTVNATGGAGAAGIGGGADAENDSDNKGNQITIQQQCETAVPPSTRSAAVQHEEEEIG
ncbi:MAG: hypothetical protein ACLUSS_07000 [Faecalibacterium sp.]